MRPPSPPQQQQQRPKLVKAKEYQQQNLNSTEEMCVREKKTTTTTTTLLIAEKKGVSESILSLEKKKSVAEKSNLPEQKSVSETIRLPEKKAVPKRKGLPEKTLPGKIDLSQWKPKSMDEKNKKKLSVITSTHVTQPSVIPQESHGSNNKSSPLVINQPDSPLQSPTTATPEKLVSPHTRNILSPVLSVASPPSPVTSPSPPVPIQTVPSSPTMKRVKSPAAENQFLIEAKQKLFSNYQQQGSIRKNLPNTPTTKKSGMVVSFFFIKKKKTNSTIMTLFLFLYSHLLSLRLKHHQPRQESQPHLHHLLALFLHHY